MVTVSGNSNPTNPTYPTNPINPTNPTTINSGELTDKNPCWINPSFAIEKLSCFFAVNNNEIKLPITQCKLAN